MKSVVRKFWITKIGGLEMDWILKEKELPTINTKVLITRKNESGESYVVAAQYWNDHKFHTASAYGGVVLDITHNVIAWQL